VNEVFFDDLGNTLERLIDDGSWRQIRVSTVQKPALRAPLSVAA